MEDDKIPALVAFKEKRKRQIVSDLRRPRTRRSVQLYETEDSDAPIAVSKRLLTRRRRRTSQHEDANKEEESKIEDVEEINNKLSSRPATGRRLVRKTQLSEHEVIPTKERRHTRNRPGSPSRRVKLRNVRKPRQKQMEVLRRRRAGERIENLTSSEESGCDRKALYDTDSELPSLPSEAGASDDAPATSFYNRQAHGQPDHNTGAVDAEMGRDGWSEDSSLAGFVVADEDDHENVDEQIPIEFQITRLKNQDLFRIVVERLVHKELGGNGDSELYQRAWRRLHDEMHTLANSKFLSSSWTPKFSRALKARPGIHSQPLPQGSSVLFDACEACGRSKHPATWRISFVGRPLDENTLDAVSQDEDGDVDADGLSVVEEDFEFHVGAVCFSNAQVAHELIHWRFALSLWVSDQLENMGLVAENKSPLPTGMSVDDRLASVCEIIQGWTDSGVVSGLYNDFKILQQKGREQSTTKRASRW